jgi:ElaB/YqjD/DUF883 family membrane-anchored ribosome-binding protein
MNWREEEHKTEVRYRHNGERSPAEIEEEIELARAEIDDTLDAIQRKLSPGQLLDQAVDQFRGWRQSGGETASEYVAAMDEAVRRNPIAATLVGVGLGWLMLSSGEPRRYTGAAERRNVDYTRTDALRGEYGGGGLGESLEEWGEETAERAGGMARRARERMGEMASKARERMRGAGESLREGRERMGEMGEDLRARGSHYGEMGHDLRGRSHELGRMARDQAERARSSLGQLLEEQPLVIGALGLAIGAMVAASLPATRREDELFGEARDDLMDRASETASEQAERARQAAESTVEHARDAAEETIEKARHSAEEGIERTSKEAGEGIRTEGPPNRPRT